MVHGIQTNVLSEQRQTNNVQWPCDADDDDDYDNGMKYIQHVMKIVASCVLYMLSGSLQNIHMSLNSYPRCSAILLSSAPL